MDSPWDKNKKEPSLDGNKPWDKETDKERIARLEKEVQHLKNKFTENKNITFDEDKIFKNKSSNKENESVIEKDKIVKKSGIGFITWILIIVAVIYVIGNLGDDDKTKTNSNSSSSTIESIKPKPNKYGEIGNETKYYECYGEMTALYKQNGLHEKNRSASIEAKETICRSYSRGEHSDYPRR